METLARKSRQSVRNARYAVQSLQRDGFLSVDVRPRRGHKNNFQINLQKLQHSKKMQPTTVKDAGSVEKTCKVTPRNKDEPSLEPSLIQKHHGFAVVTQSEEYKNAQAVKDWIDIKEALKLHV